MNHRRLVTNDEFRASALDCVYRIAMTHEEFTTDEVMSLMDSIEAVEPDDWRILGRVMLDARDEAWVVRTTSFRETNRAVAHLRPKRLWRSLLT